MVVINTFLKSNLFLQSIKKYQLCQRINFCSVNKEIKDAGQKKTSQKGGYSITGIDKAVLVIMGKYKMNEVPEYVNLEYLNSVKDRFRVRAASWLVLGTIIMFAYALFLSRRDWQAGRDLDKEFYLKHGVKDPTEHSGAPSHEQK